jgi:hypothetical protein
MTTTATTRTRTLEALHNGYAAIVHDAITANAERGGESRLELARYYLQPGEEGLQLYWNQAGDNLDQHPHVTGWTAYLNSALVSALGRQEASYDHEGLHLSAKDCRWLAGCIRSGRLVLMNNTEAAEHQASL